MTLAGWVGLLNCASAPACGDGQLETNEACDDGNLEVDDGCSASCQLEDDARTPGDDRPGYFYCAAEGLGPGVTCEGGALCCLTDGPRCATPEQGCGDPLNVATCDGPEDCGAGQSCWTFTHDRTCRAEGILAWCHTDRDCEGLSDWLPPGHCTLQGVCELSADPLTATALTSSTKRTGGANEPVLAPARTTRTAASPW